MNDGIHDYYDVYLRYNEEGIKYYFAIKGEGDFSGKYLK